MAEDPKEELFEAWVDYDFAATKDDPEAASRKEEKFNAALDGWNPPSGVASRNLKKIQLSDEYAIWRIKRGYIRKQKGI
jgi:hypothetical protein